MWPFGNQYDIWVIDYKVIIAENLTYNRSRVGFWAFIILFFTSLCLLDETENNGSSEGAPFILVIEFGLLAALYLTRRPNGIIEIDNDAKTVRVRNKYTIDHSYIVGIKVSELRSSNGYIYDYLSLVCDSEEEIGIYKLIQTSLRDKETKHIAALIAEKLSLTLIIESPNQISFDSSQKKEVVY